MSPEEPSLRRKKTLRMSFLLGPVWDEASQQFRHLRDPNKFTGIGDSLGFHFSPAPKMRLA